MEGHDPAAGAHWRSEQGEPPANCGIWPLYVGLFMALLTFFIVLVSLSPPEATRTTAVLDSVQKAFAAPATAPAAEAPFAAARSALVRLGGDLAGLLRIAHVERNRRGDEMSVRMATAELFVDGTAAPRPEIAPVLGRIVAALGSPPAGLRLQVSFALGRPRAAEDDAESALALAVARCGALARELIARGAAPGAIAIAVDPGPPDRASFAFRFLSEHRAAVGSGR